MAWTLFATKNQKRVKKWKAEHQKIVLLATKIITEYPKNNPKKIKDILKELNSLATSHIMDEDIAFYRLLKDEKSLDHNTKMLINDFIKTFKGTKMVLMNFLTEHAKPKAVIDDEFLKSFNGLVAVLAERIDFEEKNLYSLLESK